MKNKTKQNKTRQDRAERDPIVSTTALSIQFKIKVQLSKKTIDILSGVRLNLNFFLRR